jgi:LysR family positive regulator for ilvC
MNIRELELYIHLATTLHFGKTSLECNTTPSALSRTIQRLESEVGVMLFQRNNRSVQLTPAGILFREYCEETLSRYHSFRNHLHSDTMLRGEISIYCSVTAIFSILPRIFSRFRKTHPQVTIHIRTGDAAKAIKTLLAREVDISIAALPETLPENIYFIELLETPLVFIAPKSIQTTVAYRQSEIDWEKTPVIIPTEGLSRTRVDQWFAEKKIRPHIYSQVAGNEAIIAMVSMGCGVGIVPRLVLEQSILKDDVTQLDIFPQLKSFIVGVTTLEKNLANPVISSFWNIVSDEKSGPFFSP